MLGILFHLQADIADCHLLVIFMLEHQNAVRHLKTGYIKRPSAIV
ncbi:Uncharacterised protein [Shigella flexneri]|nr:Uncharacterised protein [Shigella flexneri]